MAANRTLKRGMLEVQFNWIFILIAGAVILAFFFTIIQKQQSISEQKLALEIINQLDAITTGASVAKGAAQRIDLPRAGIDFKCEEDCSCAFSVGPVTRDYQDKIIFSPQHIEGKDIVFWSSDWSVPFRVTNFLYVTNDRIKYFFVYDDSSQSTQLKEKLEQELPEQINAEFITMDNICDSGDVACIKNENYLQVKLVFLGTPPQSFSNLGQLDPSFKTTDVTGLHIEGNRLTFLKCRKNKIGDCEPPKTSAFTGDAPLYGAIFAYDQPTYECNLREATKRLSYVSQVLQRRTYVLIGDNELIARGCPYTDRTLGSLLTTADAQKVAFTNDLTSLSTDAELLKKENEELLLRSCPTVY